MNFTEPRAEEKMACYTGGVRQKLLRYHRTSYCRSQYAQFLSILTAKQPLSLYLALMFMAKPYFSGTFYSRSLDRRTTVTPSPTVTCYLIPLHSFG